MSTTVVGNGNGRKQGEYVDILPTRLCLQDRVFIGATILHGLSEATPESAVKLAFEMENLVGDEIRARKNKHQR